MSIFAMFYGYYDAICELYKLIFWGMKWKLQS
jgi:hypothetical protein